MRTLTHSTLLRNSVLATVAVVAAGFLATAYAWTNNANTLTFSRDVALPGVVLPAGTYVFEIANPGTSRDIVRVRRNGHVHYQGITLAAERPARLAASQPVTLGEAGPDIPAPITAWFPLGSSSGHRFIYR